MDQARCRPAVLERSVKRGEREPSIEQMTERVTDDLTGPGIQDYRQVRELGLEAQVSEISDPYLVGARRHDPLQQVREYGLGVPAVGRHEEAPHTSRRQRRLAHHPGHPFVIDMHTSAAELVGDPSIAVGWPLRHDLLDRSTQLGLRRCACRLTRPIGAAIVGAPRQVHQSAPSRDGDAPGPEMIDESSPLGSG